jgi:hypothetical protein
MLEREEGASLRCFRDASDRKLPPKHPVAPFPFVSAAAAKAAKKGNKVIFDVDQYQFSMMQEENLVMEAAARTGFTKSEIKALVESDLETCHVLDYISAVISNRMN